MVKQASSNADSEHRKTTRYRLGIPAIVLQNGAQVLSVEIEEFSWEGMFLLTRDQRIPAYLYPGKTITIQFSIDEPNGSSTCSVDAKITRLCKDGLSVLLVRKSSKVLDALASLSAQQSAVVGQNPDSSRLIDKRKTTQIVIDLLNRLLPGLAEQCLDECYEQISNRM